MRSEITLAEAREQFRATPTVSGAKAYLAQAITYHDAAIIGEPTLTDTVREICTWLTQKGLGR